MKKIISYNFILLVLLGLFAPLAPASAATTREETSSNYREDQCVDKETTTEVWAKKSFEKTGTTTVGGASINTGTCKWAVTTKDSQNTGGSSGTPSDPSKKQDLGDILDGTCGLSHLGGCFMYYLLYIPFYTLPSFILFIVAKLFNALVGLTLSSHMYTAATFISAAWGTVRDLSNVFFILILLYAAIELILGLGHGGAKKTIGAVILMAVLINFSMFFSKVVIDSSNVLALVFYNKILVKDKDPNKPSNYTPTFNSNALGLQEKDIAGALVSGFDPARTMDPAIFQTHTTVLGRDVLVSKNESTLAAIIVVCGGIFLWTAFSLFVAGFCFLSRLIELWILIIFSPFAFMSYALPQLSSLEYIGWNNWSKRLMSAAFMAPIFLFFLYLIAKITSENLIASVANSNSQNFATTLLLIAIPACLANVLLLKATKFAVKGSGAIGSAAYSFGKSAAKAAVGVGVGVATGGTSMLAAGTIGKAALKMTNNDNLKQRALNGDKFAKAQLNVANSLANRSFDFRQTALGKAAGKAAGINMDNAGIKLIGLDTHALQGGAAGQVKHKAEHEEKEKKKYMLSTADEVAQDKRNVEYKTDLGMARAEAKKTGFTLNEEEFKRMYEKGGAVVIGDIEKAIAGGSVETAKEINAQRSKQYIDNKEASHPHDAMGALKQNALSALRDYAPSTAAATAIGAMVAGPLGAALAFGAAQTLRTVQQSLKIHSNAPEVIAELRKGPDENKEALKKLREMIEKDKKESGGSHDEHKPSGGAAHAPTPAAGDSHDTSHAKPH